MLSILGTPAAARIKAQANVVVAPDAHGVDLLKQAHRLLDPLTRLEHVAQDHEAFGPVLVEQIDEPPPAPVIFRQWHRILLAHPF
jgi:hypothetical protein